MVDNREYGLVLAGGGTKGAYQVGVWKALKELNINVKGIVGASIGSLNGALFLQDDFKMVEDMYENIKLGNIMNIDGMNENKNIFSLSNIFNLAADYTKQKGIDNTPLRNMIKKYIDMDKIYNSNIDFGLVTFSVKNRQPLQVFKNEIPKEEMENYLLASSCFPIFKPQIINNEEYFDGGLYDNIPANMLIEKGYKNIIIADIAGVGFSKRTINKDVYIKVIKPSEDLGGTFEFNHERIINNIKLGYLDTMKAFNQMQGHMYYFRSEEFAKMLEVFNLETIYGLEYSAQIYKMNKYRIIFSPTGGTEKVANTITKSWDTVKDIDLSKTDLDFNFISLTKEDIAVIAMPSFGGVAPQLALDRLAKMKGNQCKCAIVAVYGNRAYENTLVQMEDYAVKAGFHVIAAVSAVAEHSILHQYATGRPDEK